MFVEGNASAVCRYSAHHLGYSACFKANTVEFAHGRARLTLEFRGGSRQAQVQALAPESGFINYFLGDDQSKWAVSRPLLHGVAYRQIYPGIDALYSAHQARLKSEFTVEPGADPALIRLAYSGITDMRIEPDGSLRLQTTSGVFIDDPPFVYQRRAGGTVTIASRYRIYEDQTVGFEFLEPYDERLPLQIDPVLSFSTYLGGGGIDRIHSVAVGPDGSVFVAGFTDSIDLSTSSSAVQKLSGGSTDAFVARLAPDGSSIQYWTYLGGAADDRALSLTVDADGNAYITGSTTSANFPVKSAFRATLAGGRDAFVAKLNPTGSSLVFSTYLGGSGTDIANSITLDGSRNVYIAGSTTSSNFPAVTPFQASLAGQTDAFVTKMNAAGSALVFSTYMGGSGDDKAYGLALDVSDAPVLVGTTTSLNLPVLNAAQPASGGGQDVFIAKLSAAGSALQYSTYYGGNKNETLEVGRPIALDVSGAAVIAGTTPSTNLPLVGSIYPRFRGGTSDVFVAKLNTTGNQFVFSTYLGGSSIDTAGGVAIVEGSKPYLVGYTSSSNFPIVNSPPTPLAGGYDVFALRLNAAGSQIERSEILGGVDNDVAYGIAVDAGGNLLIGGQTGSSNFPTQNPIQTTTGGSLGAFVLKIAAPGVPSAVSVTPASGSDASQSFSVLFSDPDGYLDIVETSFLISESTTSPSGCQIRYRKSGNTLELADDTGVGWLGPAAVGSAATLENSFCVLNVGSTSANGSGNSFTLVLPLTFRSAVAGPKNLYMRVVDAAGTGGDWQNRGSWTIPAGGSTPPSLVSVSPSSGSGGQQLFVFTFASIYGFSDIKWAFTNFTANGTNVNSCMGRYIQATNMFELASDSGAAWAGQGQIGAGGTIENSQCRISLALSTVSGSGSVLQLSISVTFKPAFSGQKNTMMAALNTADVLAGWTQLGTWNVVVPSAPVPTSVAPSSGSGSSQQFDFVYTDANGYTDINWTAMLIHSTLTPLSSCLIRVTRATGIVELATDGGSFGGGVVIGSGGVIQNSQCSIDATTASMTGSGATLTIRLPITFKPGFSGTKNLYMTVADNSGSVAAWTSKGTWTAP